MAKLPLSLFNFLLFSCCKILSFLKKIMAWTGMVEQDTMHTGAESKLSRVCSSRHQADLANSTYPNDKHNKENISCVVLLSLACLIHQDKINSNIRWITSITSFKYIVEKQQKSICKGLLKTGYPFSFKLAENSPLKYWKMPFCIEIPYLLPSFKFKKITFIMYCTTHVQ